MTNLVEHAYIKFLKPCKNPIAKHKTTQTVPVTDIINFEKYEQNKNREFKVKCGNSTCLAVIGITGKSRDEVKSLLEKGSRVKFPTATLRKENTDISSNEKENGSALQKKVTALNEVQKRLQKTALLKSKLLKMQQLPEPAITLENQETVTKVSHEPSTVSKKSLKDTQSNKNFLRNQNTVNTSLQTKASKRKDASTSEGPPSKIVKQTDILHTTKKSLKAKGSHTTKGNHSVAGTSSTSKVSNTTKGNHSVAGTSSITKVSNTTKGNQSVGTSSTNKGSHTTEAANKVKDSHSAETTDTAGTGVSSETSHISDSSQTSEASSKDQTAFISEIDANLVLQDPQGQEKIIRNLKRQLIDALKVNRGLRAQNDELQKKVVDRLPSIQSSLLTANETAEKSLQDRIASGENLQTGTIDRISQTIHAGFGVWIAQDDYGRAKFKSKRCPTKFIRAMSRCIFTVDVLKASSVTGQLSNRDKKKNDATPRPALNCRDMNALKAITRYWMNEQKFDENQILQAVENIGSTISKQISDLNRKPSSRKNGTKKSKPKSKEIIPLEEDDDEESAESGNESVNSKELIPPEEEGSSNDDHDEQLDSREEIQTLKETENSQSEEGTDFSEEEGIDKDSGSESHQVDTPSEDAD